MADDGIVRIGTQVDVSGLRSGMEEAASVVETSSQSMAEAMEAARVASQNLADAQAQLGAAAEAGSDQAAEVIAQYQALADQAEATAEAFASTAASGDAVEAAFSQLAAATADAAVSQANLRTAIKSVVDGTTPYAAAVQSLTGALRENWEATQVLASAKSELALTMEANAAATGEETEATLALVPASMEAAAAQQTLAASSREATMAASLAGREVGGFLGGALGRIAATAGGLGPIFASPFVVGGIAAVAAGEIIYSLVEKIVAVRQSAEEAAENIQRSFDQLTDSVNQSTASLITQGDRLQGQLDKLLGRPGANGLQVAFDEASASALRLSASIQKDIDKMEQLVDVTNKKNSIGFWGSLFTGQAETGDTQNMLKQAEDSIRSVNDEYQSVLDQARATGNKDALFSVQQDQLSALEGAYKKAEASVNGSLQSMLDKQEVFNRYHIGEDYTASINMARGALREWAAEQQNIGQQFRNENLQQQVTPLQDNHAEDSLALKQQRQIQEMSQETARAIDEAARQEGAALERVHKAMADAGDSPFLESLAHAIPAAAGEARQQLVALAEAVGKLKHPEPDQDSGKQIEQNLDTAEEAQIKLNEAQLEAYDIGQKNANATAEATLRAQEALHTITPLSAAEQQAALHTREYTEALAALNAQLQVFKQVGKDAEAAQVQNQISQLQGSHTVQATGDQAAIQQQIAQPWLNAFNQINSSWLQVQNQMFYSTRNIGLAFAKMGQQIFLSIVDNMEKAALFSLEKELTMRLAHEATKEAQVVVDAQTAAQSNAISAASSTVQGLHAAKLAFKNTYAQVSKLPPPIGTILAPILASAAFIAVAAFDEGTGYVPHDGLAMIHEGEAVIPAPTMADLRGSSGGGDLTINQNNNFHGFNPDREFQRQLRRNASHVASALQHHLRQTGKA